MEAAISIHARERMLQRGISKEEVRDALANPDNRIFEDDLEVFEKRRQNHLLRVYVNASKIPSLVVTCYKTSQLKKYT